MKFVGKLLPAAPSAGAEVSAEAGGAPGSLGRNAGRKRPGFLVDVLLPPTICRRETVAGLLDRLMQAVLTNGRKPSSITRRSRWQQRS